MARPPGWVGEVGDTFRAQVVAEVLDALPRPLLLRFAWEGLSEAEREAAITLGAVADHDFTEAFTVAWDAAENGWSEPAQHWDELTDEERQVRRDAARSALDAALMTGGEG